MNTTTQNLDSNFMDEFDSMQEAKSKLRQVEIDLDNCRSNSTINWNHLRELIELRDKLKIEVTLYKSWYSNYLA